MAEKTEVTVRQVNKINIKHVETDIKIWKYQKGTLIKFTLILVCL